MACPGGLELRPSTRGPIERYRFEFLKERLLITQPASLFDNLIGPREQIRWHRDVESLGSPEVDHKLELGGL